VKRCHKESSKFEGSGVHDKPSNLTIPKHGRHDHVAQTQKLLVFEV
jgi:hypothetical protein